MERKERCSRDLRYRVFAQSSFFGLGNAPNGKAGIIYGANWNIRVRERERVRVSNEGHSCKLGRNKMARYWIPCCPLFWDILVILCVLFEMRGGGWIFSYSCSPKPPLLHRLPILSHLPLDKHPKLCSLSILHTEIAKPLKVSTTQYIEIQRNTLCQSTLPSPRTLAFRRSDP